MMIAREYAHAAQTSPGGFAASARHQARQILSGSQYQTRPERSFRPFAGVLGAIGRFFHRVFDPLWRFLVDHLFHPVSGPLSDVFGNWWPLLVLFVALVAGVLVGRIVIKRRSLPGRKVLGEIAETEVEDPDGLEVMARQAELDGDMQAAVRLRFRAGVIRLERMGAITRAPTLTDRELSRSLRSGTFDALASDLESIVYGGAMATEQQAADALSGWSKVNLEVARNLKAADPNAADRADSTSGAGAMNSANVPSAPGSTRIDSRRPASSHPRSPASSLVGVRARWRLLPAGWKVTLVIVGVVVLAGALIKLTSVLTEGSSPGGPDSSSFSPGPTGLSAFSGLLTRNGDHVSQFTSPLGSSAFPAGSTVVVAAPTSWQTADSMTLERILESGGTVVIAGQPPAGLLSALSPVGSPQWSAEELTHAATVGSGPLVFGVSQVDSTGPGAWSTTGDASPLLASGGTGGTSGTSGTFGDQYLALSVHVGAGTLVLLSSPAPLQNRLIGEADNAAFSLDITSKSVVFDEYDHGYGRPGNGVGGLPGSWKAALLLALAAVLVWMLSASRRFGPPENTRARTCSTSRRLRGRHGHLDVDGQSQRPRVGRRTTAGSSESRAL